MDRICPMCQTPMVERNNIHVCPRNEIGDCAYDPYFHEFEATQEREMEQVRPY
jgi:protein PhnA